MLRLSQIPKTSAGSAYSRVATSSSRLKSTRVQKAQLSASPATVVFASATDLFSSLRWKAANALAASLSPEERKNLLEQFTPAAAPVTPSINGKSTTATNGHRQNQQRDDETRRKSIAEAVAEATALEAQRQEHIWQKEKEKIVEQAEKAAQARVENELATQRHRRLAFEQWQQQVQQESSGNRAESSPSNDVVETTETVVAAGATAAEETATAVSDHPILGPCLFDHGYKRIHLVSAKDLANIEVWQKQRIYRHNRAKAMAADKMKTLHLGGLGIISLHEDANGKLSVLDGQHRIGMMNVLKQKKDLRGVDFLDQVLVEVHRQTEDHDERHAQDIFEEINKAQPIKLVDMPGVAKGGENKVITAAVERLEQRFEHMFKASQNCRSPHMNVDNLRDCIFTADVLKRHGIKTAKALEEWLLRQNESLANKFQSSPEHQQSVPARALKKATDHGFYLGLESQWLKN